MYKKPLAILLSVLLLITSFITVFTFSAFAASTNLVADGKFENGFTDWEVFNNTGNSSAAFSVVKEGENSVLKAIPGLSMFKKVNLEAGVTYTIGFDFKFDTNATVPATYDSFYRVGFASSVGALGNSNFVGPYASGNKYYSVYGNQRNDATNWKSHTFTYTPSTNMTTYFVIGSYNGDGKANFFVDNVFLAKTEDIITVTTVAGEGGAVSNTVKTFKGDSVTVTAKASLGYLFDGWYDAIGAKVSNEAVYTFTANAGTELTAKFVSSGESTSNYIVNGDFEQPFTTDTISNTSVTAVVGKWGKIYSGVARMEATETASFTSADSAEKNGTRYITSGSTKDSNKYIRAFGQYIDLPVGDYILEFDAKSTTKNLFAVSIRLGQGSLNSATDMVYEYLDESAQWQHYSIKFTAETAGVYQIAFGGNTQGGAEGDFSVDNVSLEVFVEENPNYIVNGDFEQPFTTDKISDVSVTAVKGKWGKIYSGVARMEATETANFTSDDSAEKNGTRYITSGATKDSNQYIRAFGQYTDLTAGEYVLEFDAKATVSNMFVVSLKKGQQSINIATDLVIKYLEQSSQWKHYSIRFTADEDSMYQLAFGGNTQGKGEGDFSIDNVSIEAYVEENPNLVVNGDFETAFTTDKISDVSVTAVKGKWGKIYSGVARMEATETANFTSVDSAEKNGTRYITSGATKDSNQYIRAFGQYVNLTAGEYVLEFDAKATVSDMFVVSVIKGQQSINIATDFVLEYLEQSSQWKHYTIRFTADEDGMYQLAFGGNTQGKGEGDFSIDNVSLLSAEGYITVTAVTDGGGTVTHPIGKVELGTAATVTATPDENYIFAGWYKGNELVSADAEYTFTVTESVELKAKFELDLGDDDAIIKNGKFDTNSTVGWNVVVTAGGSKATVVVDDETGSAVVKTTGKGAVAFMQKVNLQANTEYLISFDLKFDDFAAIPEEYESFYRSGFLANPNGGLGNANFIDPNATGNKYKSLANMITTTDKNAWNSISYTYTPTTDMETWFVIGAYNNQGESNYSIDNVAIVIKEDATGVSVAAISHGGSGSVTSSKKGLVSPGEMVTLTATPNEGSAFGGWYINGTLISDTAEYNHTVTSNDIIYARFLDKNNPESNQMLDNSDFATEDLSGWGTNNISTANDTVEYVTVKGESFVKLGESDMLYQSVELEPYSTYMIRITTRIPDIRDKSYGVHDLGFFRFGISEFDKPNVLQSGALEKDPYSYTSTLSGQCDCEPNNRYHCAKKWGTYTYIYSNNSPDTVLANVVIGTPYCKSDVHIKSFEFIKYVDGIVDFESDILYGEDFFNNVKNPSFEEKTTDADWGSKLPKGWTIKNEGKKGTNYLSVSGNESKTYSFQVRTGVTYVVAFSLRTDKDGTSSVSIVDDNGNPWGDSFDILENKAVFQPKATGKWQRMGAHLYIADNPEGYTNVNIKISAGSNALDIDEITVTKLGYATHSVNPNVYTDNSYDYENPVWYSPTLFYKLADGTTVDGAVDNPSDGDLEGDYGENANTGDYSERSLMVVALILIPSALAMLFTAKRTNKNKKGGNQND
ncbi:MAG: hypothetical protein E7551_08375 [Ruminococcaceae bacterium]|nr:hypothetical protein [Oscillospiraceae bacterium]